MFLQLCGLKYFLFSFSEVTTSFAELFSGGGEVLFLVVLQGHPAAVLPRCAVVRVRGPGGAGETPGGDSAAVSAAQLLSQPL